MLFNTNNIVFSNSSEIGKIWNQVDNILFLKIVCNTLYNSGKLDITSNSDGKI